MRTLLLTISFLLFGYPAAIAGEYPAQVSTAELAITRGDLRNALHHYRLAFASRTLPFAVDLYNASVCAIKSRDYTQAMQYCHMLAVKGVGDKFFGKSIYRPLQLQKGWESLLATARHRKNALEQKHGALLCLIDSLVAKDQWVNRLWRISGMQSEPRKHMDLTYDTIGLHLKHLFDSLGFLTEEKIGAYVKEDTNLQRGQLFDVIIIHNYTARMTGDTLFNETLRQALQRGEIKPEHYASLRDFTGGSFTDYFGTSHLYTQYRCTLYREKRDEAELQRIGNNRKRIGLPVLKDHEQKLLYNITHRHDDFIIHANLTVYKSFANEASEQSFLNNSEIVVRNIPHCTL